MTGLPEKAYYRPDEIAAYFSVTPRTVLNWIDTGKLPAVKIAGTTVRISRDALVSLLNAK